MTSDRFQHVERLYFSALERDASERAAFLREACAGDEALRREVEALLEYGPRAQGFMETAALEMEARAMARDRLDRLQGKVLGAYEIVA